MTVSSTRGHTTNKPSFQTHSFYFLFYFQRELLLFVSSVYSFPHFIFFLSLPYFLSLSSPFLTMSKDTAPEELNLELDDVDTSSDDSDTDGSMAEFINDTSSESDGSDEQDDEDEQDGGKSNALLLLEANYFIENGTFRAARKTRSQGKSSAVKLSKKDKMKLCKKDKMKRLKLAKKPARRKISKK
jgi:hypothetical protein